VIFRDYLKEIMQNVDGSLAATLMGDDGIPVADLVFNESIQLDIKTLAIEFSKILKDAEQITTSLMDGEVEELLVTSKSYSMLFLPISSSYFVVLLLTKGGSLGKGRYLLKQYRPKILEQL